MGDGGEFTVFQSPQFLNFITLNSLANEQSFHKSFSKVEHHCNRWSWCRSCLPCISWSKRQPRPPHCYFGKDLQGKRCPRYVEKVYEFTCHNIYISIILNHIMIFGVRPFVVFPLPPPPPGQKTLAGFWSVSCRGFSITSSLISCQWCNRHLEGETQIVGSRGLISRG